VPRIMLVARTRDGGSAINEIRAAVAAVNPGLVIAAAQSSPEFAVVVAAGLPSGLTFAGPELVVLRAREGVEPKWIQAFLRRAAVWRVLRANVMGAAEPHRVAATILPRLRMANSPTPAERGRRLVTLDELDECAKLRAAALALLRELPARLVFCVRTMPLAKLLDADEGLATKTVAPASRSVLHGADIVDGRIAGPGALTVGRQSGVPLSPGDLVLSREGPDERRIGAAAVYDGTPARALVGPGLQRMRVARNADADYLWAWLQSPDARAQIAAVVRPSGSGRRFALPLTALRALRVPAPRLELRASIGASARECRRIAERAEEQRRHLNDLRVAYENTVFGSVDLDPAETPVPGLTTRVATLKSRLSEAQRTIWDEVAIGAKTLSELAPPGESERARRTLELLECVGVVVRDTTGDIERWRQPDAETELLEAP